MDWDKILSMCYLGVVSADSAHRIYRYWLTKDERNLTPEDKEAIEDFLNG